MRNFYVFVIVGLTFTTICDAGCDWLGDKTNKVFDCIGKQACKDCILYCDPGEDCRVNCEGEQACEGNFEVHAQGASSLTMNCGVGDCCGDSCKQSCKGSNVKIYCPEGSGKSCTVKCAVDENCGKSCSDMQVCDDMNVFEGVESADVRGCIVNCVSTVHFLAEGVDKVADAGTYEVDGVSDGLRISAPVIIAIVVSSFLAGVLVTIGMWWLCKQKRETKGVAAIPMDDEDQIDADVIDGAEQGTVQFNQ